jgi:selenocysteine lyase/cysteine desulfurase
MDPASDDDVRRLFDIPSTVAYLNCAYMGPAPRAVVEAGWMAMERKARPWTVATEDFFVPTETLRGLVADLLGAGADADGVAVVPSVSFGMSTFAAQLALRPGQVVLVPTDEFPSNLYPWVVAAEAAGASVVRVARDGDGGFDVPLRAEIDRRGDQVALVAAMACHWTDGTPVDLVALGQATRGVGAALALDLSQSLGAVPFDVDAVQPDVVAGVTYKWLLGPYGLGYTWFAPRWRDGVPLDHGWANRAGAEDFARLTEPAVGYRAGARRYDVGESAFHHLVGQALAALRLVGGWGDEVEAHSRRLTDRIAEGAAGLGLGVAPPHLRSPHLLGLGLAGTGVEPAALAGHLADAGVHVSVRGTSVRVSAHRFNRDDDVDRLLAALAGAVGRPVPG